MASLVRCKGGKDEGEGKSEGLDGDEDEGWGDEDEVDGDDDDDDDNVIPSTFLFDNDNGVFLCFTIPLVSAFCKIACSLIRFFSAASYSLSIVVFIVPSGSMFITTTTLSPLGLP